MLSTLSLAAISFAVTIVVIIVLHPLAVRGGLVDHPSNAPDGRKQHKGNPALIGGIAIGAAFFIATDIPPSLLAAAVVLLALGLADDMFDIPALVKLAGQITAAALLVYGGDFIISTLGTAGSGREIELGAFAAPFTMLALVGLINAMNMSDGIDGLASGLSLMALAHILIIMSLLNAQLAPALFAQIITLTAALCAFMIFNLRLIKNRQIFLGDSGAMLLGLLLGYILIVANTQSQNGYLPNSLTPWLLALPIFETLTLSYRRLRQGRSPLAADRLHLHHILQDRGFTKTQTLLLILALATALIWFGTAIFFAAAATETILEGLAAGFVFVALPLFYYRLFVKKITKKIN